MLRTCAILHFPMSPYCQHHTNLPPRPHTVRLSSLGYLPSLLCFALLILLQPIKYFIVISLECSLGGGEDNTTCLRPRASHSSAIYVCIQNSSSHKQNLSKPNTIKSIYYQHASTTSSEQSTQRRQRNEAGYKMPTLWEEADGT